MGKDDASSREAELRSALERLKMAVFTLEGGRTLRAMNSRAVALFERECLTWDLLAARPAHPLSQLLRELLETPLDREPETRLVEFPSGCSYRIEPSRRSPKGRERALMLLVEPVAAAATPEKLFAEWKLTPAEREVARGLMEGASSDEIAARQKIAPSTLKSHLRSLLAKSGASNRSQFLAKLLRRG